MSAYQRPMSAQPRTCHQRRVSSRQLLGRCAALSRRLLRVRKARECSSCEREQQGAPPWRAAASGAARRRCHVACQPKPWATTRGVALRGARARHRAPQKAADNIIGAWACLETLVQRR